MCSGRAPWCQVAGDRKEPKRSPQTHTQTSRSPSAGAVPASGLLFEQRRAERGGDLVAELLDVLEQSAGPSDRENDSPRDRQGSPGSQERPCSEEDPDSRVAQTAVEARRDDGDQPNLDRGVRASPRLAVRRNSTSIEARTFPRAFRDVCLGAMHSCSSRSETLRAMNHLRGASELGHRLPTVTSCCDSKHAASSSSRTPTRTRNGASEGQRRFAAPTSARSVFSLIITRSEGTRRRRSPPRHRGNRCNRQVAEP